MQLFWLLSVLACNLSVASSPSASYLTEIGSGNALDDGDNDNSCEKCYHDGRIAYSLGVKHKGLHMPTLASSFPYPVWSTEKRRMCVVNQKALESVGNSSVNLFQNSKLCTKLKQQWDENH